MAWYALMLNKEKEDQYEAKLNMIEYLASFTNYDAVRQTREARENKKVMSEEAFDQTLRDLTGRDLSPEALSKATRVVAEEPKPDVVKKKGSISIDDLRKYTEMGNDQVTFHPIKK